MAAIQTMSFSFIDKPRAQVIAGAAFTLQLDAFASGVLSPTPTATITITGPGGGALVTPVTAAAVTVDGSGHMSYVLAAGNTATRGANYEANWQVTIGGVVYPVVQLFDIVRFPLVNVVQPSDLTKYHFDLASSFGTESSAQTYIEEAFIDVWQVLDSKGRRPYLILSPEDLRRPIENLALSRYFLARVKADGDRWSVFHKHHQNEYERWIATANFSYDADDSGTIDGTTNLSSQSGEDGRTSGSRWRV